MENKGQLKYLSLFSGIGGFELGIQKAYEEIYNKSERRSTEERGDDDRDKSSTNGSNGERRRTHPNCVGYSEIDKYATQIYRKQFPNHKNYGDITKINAKDLPEFELIVGGFPCQSFSIAGKRGGFSDTRGTLFFDIARIAQQRQPRLLLLENVKGLLSHDKGKTFRTIINTLDELGYDLQWQVLNSKYHGVPQNRERVFIIGHLRGTTRPEVFPIGGSDRENNVGLKELKGGSQGNRVYDPDGVSTTLASEAGGQGAKTGLYAIDDYNHKVKKDGIVPAIRQTNASSAPGNASKIKNNMKIRRLTPTECERLQGFPDGWTEKGIDEDSNEVEISDTQRYKSLGNAVTVNVIRDIMVNLI